MQGNENRPPLSVGELRPVVERRIFACLAGKHHAQSLSFEGNAHQAGETQHNVAFGNTGGAARAGIGAAVRRIEDDDAQRVARGGRLFCWRLLRRGRARRSLRYLRYLR